MSKFNGKAGLDIYNHLHKISRRSQINKIEQKQLQHIDKYALQNLTRFKENILRTPHYKEKIIQYLKKTEVGRNEVKKLTPDQLKIVESLLGVKF